MHCIGQERWQAGPRRAGARCWRGRVAELPMHCVGGTLGRLLVVGPAPQKLRASRARGSRVGARSDPSLYGALRSGGSAARHASAPPLSGPALQSRMAAGIQGHRAADPVLDRSPTQPRQAGPQRSWQAGVDVAARARPMHCIPVIPKAPRPPLDPIPWGGVGTEGRVSSVLCLEISIRPPRDRLGKGIARRPESRASGCIRTRKRWCRAKLGRCDTHTTAPSDFNVTACCIRRWPRYTDSGG